MDFTVAIPIWLTSVLILGPYVVILVMTIERGLRENDRNRGEREWSCSCCKKH